MNKNKIFRFFVGAVLFLVLSAALTSCPKPPLNPWDDEGVSLGLVTAAPVIETEGGTYNKDISIVLSCGDPDAVVYYTTDGSDPDESSAECSGAVCISGDGTSTVVKAVAINPAKAASHVIAASYNIEYFELRVAAGDNGSTAPSAAVKIAQDSSVVVSASADSTYAFSHWSVESGSGVMIDDIYSESTEVTLTEGGGEVKANFAPGISLTLSSDGNGSTVPAGSVLVASGIPRAVKAIPDTGYQFSQWSQVSGSIVFSDSGSAETEVTLTGGSGEIRADFEPRIYNLTIEPDPNGSTVPSGSVEVQHDIAQSISASPDSGWAFSRWTIVSGSGVSFADASAASTSVILTGGDAVIQPVFTVERILTIADDGNGTTTPVAGNYNIADGTAFVISASPDTGFGFSHWSTGGNAVVSAAASADTTVILSGGDGSVTANFTDNTYALTLQSGGNGTVDPSGTFDVVHGVETPISAVPTTAGYIFDSWTVESGSASVASPGSSSTTVSLTSGAATVQANFALETFTLTMTDNGFGSTSADAEVTYNVPHNISASPDTGYEFDSWQVISGTASVADPGSASTSVTLTSGPATVQAVFTPLDYTLTINNDGNGSTSPAGVQTVSHAAATAVSATPTTAGYEFSHWSVESGTAGFDDENAAITNVTLLDGNATIQANFMLETYMLTMTDNGYGSTSADAVVTYGIPHSISATPDTGYEFDSWSVTSGTASIDEAGSASTTVTLTSGEATLQATFVLKTYSLSVTDDGNGTTVPSGTQTVNHGESISISATPYADFVFSHWSVESGTGVIFDDENAAATNVSLTSGGSTIRANFLPVYSLTVMNDGNGTTSPTGIVDVTHGIAKNISATPVSGYYFDGWYTSDSGVSFENDLLMNTTVTLTGGDAVINATFKNWAEEAIIAASNVINKNRFGEDCDISGNYLIAGASNDNHNGSGAAYIFNYNGTLWTEQEIITDSTGRTGASVSIDGDYVIVGSTGLNTSGCARIYKRSGTSWDEQAFLHADFQQVNDDFGQAVSIDGIFAVAGCPGYNTVGAAYVFISSGDSSWIKHDILRPVPSIAGDEFGSSVEIDGDYIIVGAMYDDEREENAGAAYIFKRNVTAWERQQKLLPPAGDESYFFGQSVAIEGEYAVVGAACYDTGVNTGAAYIFKRSGTSWSVEAKLLPDELAEYDNFGCTVATDTNYTVVGANSDDDNGENSGSVYIFKRSGSNWEQQAKITASDGAVNDNYGSVAISGNRIIVGAGVNFIFGESPGSVYIYNGE